MEDTRRLTSGNPLKKIFLFTLPILIGNMFQQFYSLVDAVIVGQTVGEDAFGGVGATGTSAFLILNFAFGMTVGFSVLTAQRFGAKDDGGVKKSFANSIMLTAAVSAVLTVIAMFVAKPLLNLQANEKFFGYAYDYISIIFAFIIVTMFYNLFSNVLRSIGDSRTPLYFLILASFINIGLDLLFIINFHMGVKGAAAATVISQAVAAAACAVYAGLRYPVLRVRLKHFKPDFALIKKQLYNGFPMGLQFSLISIGLFFVQAAIKNLDAELAARIAAGVETVYPEGAYQIAFTAASKIDMVACQFMLATSAAIGVYTGQNYGAGNYPRISKGVKAGIIISVGGSLICGLAVILLYRPLTVLFIPGEPEEIYALSGRYLLVNGSLYFVLGLLGVFRGVLQGAGRGLLVLIGGGVELVTRTALALLAMRYWGYIGVCFCAAMTWVAAASYLFGAYFLSRKSIKRGATAESIGKAELIKNETLEILAEGVESTV